jgi:hypothetical protein
MSFAVQAAQPQSLRSRKVAWLYKSGAKVWEGEQSLSRFPPLLPPPLAPSTVIAKRGKTTRLEGLVGEGRLTADQGWWVGGGGGGGQLLTRGYSAKQNDREAFLPAPATVRVIQAGPAHVHPDPL